jgi:hypothetical protein
MDTNHQSILALQATSIMVRLLLLKQLRESGPALTVKSLEEESPSRLAMPMLLSTSVPRVHLQYAIALSPNALTAEVKVNF